jgi:hypothetical protein
MNDRLIRETPCLLLLAWDNGYSIGWDIEAALDRIYDQAFDNFILRALGYDKHTPDLRLDLLGNNGRLITG